MRKFLFCILFLLLLSYFTSNIGGTNYSENDAIDLTQKAILEKSEISKSYLGENNSYKDIRAVLELNTDCLLKIDNITSTFNVEVEVIYRNMIQIRMDRNHLEALSTNPSVLCIREPVLPIANEITSEGVAALKADILHTYGFLGDEIKVAIIDIGFDLTNPEIVDNIEEKKSFRIDGDIEGGSEETKAHGTACAEIVVDVAPKVKLYLINFETDLEYLMAVDYAIYKEVDIITTSIGFLNVGPYDGTNYIAETADKSAQSGILFVTSTGNAAHSHWKGMFRDDDEDGYHNFEPDDETNDILLESGNPIKIYLSWDDWPTSTQDYDLHLYDSMLNLVAESTSPQTGIQPPTEYIFYTPPITDIYRIVISKSITSESKSFHLFCFSSELEHYIEEGSITSPADSKDSLAIGAVTLEEYVAEPYSSRGPTDDGRVKPDLMAFDGVSTSSYGNLAFFGTSAAAPHVAGVASILLSVNRSLTHNELRHILETTAIDKGPPGKDTTYGMGVIDAYKALQEIYIEPQNNTILVHAYPDNYEFPEIPPQELSINISIFYIYKGVNTSISASTPFQFKADWGSTATIKVESIPFGYKWHEWDNYGYGRTTTENLKITVDKDYVLIAYFTKISIVNDTILEIHAHPTEFEYPNEPPGEMPLTFNLTYTYNHTIHSDEQITIGATFLRLKVDPNSTALLTVVKIPPGFEWNGWQRVGSDGSLNKTIRVEIKENITSIVVAYLKPIIKGEFMVTADPEVLVYIPGQKADFTILITPLNGFDGDVILEVEAPPEVEVQLTPKLIHPPGSAILTVTTDNIINDRIEITIKAIFENKTIVTTITLQAWSIPGFSPTTILTGSIVAAVILYIKRVKKVFIIKYYKGGSFSKIRNMIKYLMSCLNFSN